MSDENRSVPPENSVEIRTPMKMNLSHEQAQAIPGMPRLLAQMAGGQAECDTTVHQFICVEGTVSTTVTADCRAEAFCLNFGIGTCPTDDVDFAVSETCTFKFFQELCVEVFVSVSATATCSIDKIKCGEIDTGPCPTQPTLPT